MELNEKLKNMVWTEKYRPQTINDCVLPERLKAEFHGFVKEGKMPNLLLSGGPGLGKSTIAQAVIREMGGDFISLNGSMTNIDALRNDVKSFASSVSLFNNKRKIVLIEEADFLNPNSFQPALRDFTERYSANCGFILTCNYKTRLLLPMHSRFTNIEFAFSPGEANEMRIHFFKRLCFILETEGIEYNKSVLVELIRKHFPDMRRIINEVERYSRSGAIDTGILVSLLDQNFDALVNILKEKKFPDMRKWVAENSHLDSNVIIRKIYDKASVLMKPLSVVSTILLCSKYQNSAAIVADQEINTTAFLTEVMIESEWL